MIVMVGLSNSRVGILSLLFSAENYAFFFGNPSTHSFLFGVLLTACLITMVALSYLPALALGPILERLLFGT
jgi:K+-transporting ATPase A subunit